MKKLIFLLMFLICFFSKAQVLDKSYGNIFKALTTTQRDAVPLGVDDKAIINNITTNQLEQWNGVAWVGMDLSALLVSYLQLSGGTLTGQLNSSTIIPRTTLSYDLGNSTNVFSRGYLNRVLFPTTDGQWWAMQTTTSGLDLGFGKIASPTAGYVAAYTLDPSGGPTSGTDLVTLAYANANYGSGTINLAANYTWTGAHIFDNNQTVFNKSVIINSTNPTSTFQIGGGQIQFVPDASISQNNSVSEFGVDSSNKYYFSSNISTANIFGLLNFNSLTSTGELQFTDSDIFWKGTSLLGGGSGNVTAASSFGTDNRLIRSDGTGKGLQSSGITISDGNSITGVAGLTANGNVTSPEYISTPVTSTSYGYGLFYFDSDDDRLKVGYGGVFKKILTEDDSTDDQDASEVLYDDTETNQDVTNVQDAIEDIYGHIANSISWELNTNKTIAEGDEGKIFYKDSLTTGVKTFTIPTQASLPYNRDVLYTFNHEGGAGIIRVKPESSAMTLKPKRLSQKGTMSVIRRGDDNWVWIGAHEPDINANAQEYPDSNAFALLNNTNATTGLSAVSGTTIASVANTSPSPVSWMWEITSNTVNSITRARETFTLSDGAGTYEVGYWIRTDAVTPTTTARRWESGTTDSTYYTDITNVWQYITQVVTVTSTAPILSFYTNRLATGSVGDKIFVTGFTIKLIETGL